MCAVYRNNASTTVEDTVDIPRQCEFCGCAYTFKVRVAAFGFVDWGYGGKLSQEGEQELRYEVELEARRKLRYKVDRVKQKYMQGKKEVDRVGVLCPSCNRFSSRATVRCFPKGERRTVLSWLRREQLMAIFGLVLLPAVILLLAGWLSLHFRRNQIGGESAPIWIVVSGGVVAAFVIGRYLCGLLGAIPRAFGIVAKLDREAVHAFLVELYGVETATYLDYTLAGCHGGWARAVINYIHSVETCNTCGPKRGNGKRLALTRAGIPLEL